MIEDMGKNQGEQMKGNHNQDTLHEEKNLFLIKGEKFLTNNQMLVWGFRL